MNRVLNASRRRGQQIFFPLFFLLLVQVLPGLAQSTLTQETNNPINPCGNVAFFINISPPGNGATYTGAQLFGNNVLLGTFPSTDLEPIVAVTGNDGTGHFNVFAILSFSDGSHNQTPSIAVQVVPIGLNPISGAANLNCTSPATFSSSFVGSPDFVPAATQISSYAWSLPNSNWVINSGNMGGGSLTPTVTVTPDANGTGNMQITTTMTCGYAFTSPILAVTRATPAPTFSSSNPNAVCNNATSTFALNAPCGATSYNWSISGNSNVTFQASGTQSLTTTSPSAAVTGGTVGSSGVTLTAHAVWPGGVAGGTTSVSLATGLPRTPSPISPGSENVLPNETISFIAIPANHWAVGDGTILTGQGTGAITVKVANVTSGTLSVVAVNQNSCGSGGEVVGSYPIGSGGGGIGFSYHPGADSSSFENEGFRALSSVTSPMVYPNPAINSFHVLMPQTDFTKAYIKVYDVSGHLLKAVVPVGQATLVDASRWARGEYLVVVFDGKQVTTRKFMKL